MLDIDQLPTKRWWPLAAAFLTALLLIAGQQVYFGLRDVREEAIADATAILSFLDGRPEVIDDKRLAYVAGKFKGVTWVSYCVSDFCHAEASLVEGAGSCSDKAEFGSICVRSDPYEVGSRVVLRYSVEEELVGTARDILLITLIGALGVLTWSFASRRYRAMILAAQETLRFSATHDALTGLLNRSAFEALLKKHIVENKGSSALLNLDLDGFKDINDTHGHSTGDFLLARISERLVAAAGPNAVVARLGGDEFAVLTPVEDGNEARGIAHRLLEVMNKPVSVEANAFKLGVSIGIAKLSGVASAEEALRRADLAMYDAKKSGKGQHRSFTNRLSDETQERYVLKQELQQAIENGEIFIHHQPQVDGQGVLRGSEVLARWRNPRLGVVSPDRFITLAEETGLILPLGQLVIRLACEELCQARTAGVHLPYISVNVSPKQLTEQGFLVSLDRVVRAFGLGPRDIELEITESTLVDPSVESSGLLNQISSLGYRLAIDDFGTGFSSLSRLQSIAVDKLKIDKAFVSVIEGPNGTSVIAETILALAQKLRLKTVAEGVETADQAVWLKNAGCELMQGYLFARPMPVADLVTWANQDPSSRLSAQLSESARRTLKSNVLRYLYPVNTSSGSSR